MENIICIINKFNNNNIIDDINIFEHCFKLFTYEYVIFITNRYYGFFKRGLLKYFDKYNILYLNYDKKNIILKYLENINNFIKNDNKKNKDIVLQMLNINKLKLIYFLENNIEPNTMYKKILFSKEQLFLSLDNYAIKKMEYKFRTFCQIAEKLGAKNISIISKIKKHEISSTNININTNVVDSGVKINSKHISNSDIDLLFIYTNHTHNLLLNKYYILDLIDKENEFFISKEDFHSDIDLKFLINARCINLIKNYDTDIIIHTINEVELKIFTKALGYGLNLGYSNKIDNIKHVNIKIEFIDIYEKPENILGYMLYTQDEGFIHLTNIIKLDIKNNNKNINNNEYIKQVYGKINDFLKSHIISLNNGYFCIEKNNNKNSVLYDTEYINFSNNKSYNIINAYDTIITKNFTQNEINTLFYEYFKNDLSNINFKRFRDILIFGHDNLNTMIFKNDINDIINKFYFIVCQYNNIFYHNNLVLLKINEYINKKYDNIIDEATNTKEFKDLIYEEYTNLHNDDDIFIHSEIQENNILIDCSPDFSNEDEYMKEKNNITNTFKNFKNFIIKTLLNAFNNSYLIKHGIEDITSSLQIYIMVIIDINNNFESKFYDLMVSINKNISYDNTTETNCKKRPRSTLKKEITYIINNILTFILRRICDEIYGNDFLLNPLFVKKNICNIILKHIRETNQNNDQYMKNNNDKYKKDEDDDNTEEYKYILLLLNKFINNVKCISNYEKYNIFYTWDDFQKFVNYYKFISSNKKQIKDNLFDDNLSEYGSSCNSLSEPISSNINQINNNITDDILSNCISPSDISSNYISTDTNQFIDFWTDDISYYINQFNDIWTDDILSNDILSDDISTDTNQYNDFWTDDISSNTNQFNDICSDDILIDDMVSVDISSVDISSVDISSVDISSIYTLYNMPPQSSKTNNIIDTTQYNSIVNSPGITNIQKTSKQNNTRIIMTSKIPRLNKIIYTNNNQKNIKTNVINYHKIPESPKIYNNPQSKPIIPVSKKKDLKKHIDNFSKLLNSSNRNTDL
jgi:hypothetical protein